MKEEKEEGRREEEEETRRSNGQVGKDVWFCEGGGKEGGRRRVER